MHADTTRGEGSQESFGNHDEKVKMGWNTPPSPRTTLGGGWLAVCGRGGGGAGGWRQRRTPSRDVLTHIVALKVM
jgi:hypothetical protein